MKSPIAKRPIVRGGRKTSVSLEEPFWRALKDIARSRNKTVQQVCAEIDSTRTAQNFSSAIRLFVLDYYRSSVPGQTKG
jgi:predicted DNA-binding ribbon-helix-helix protein